MNVKTRRKGHMRKAEMVQLACAGWSQMGETNGWCNCQFPPLEQKRTGQRGRVDASSCASSCAWK